MLAAVAVALVTACGGRQAPGPASPGPVAALMPEAPEELGPAYRLRQYDEVDIKFIYQPDMNTHATVRPDGRISVPGMGELGVVGMTPAELEDLIEKESAAALREPEVTVVVTKLGDQRVYIGGEVESPGFVSLRPGMTLLQAVLQTGGPKKTAKLDSVLLLTPAADGQFAAARVNLAQVVEDGVPERVRLRPNDVVYVPPTWVANANVFVDQWVRGLIPALPRVSAGARIGGD
jgi:polysaccharide export outer membrane protein